ncbi:MAG: DNA repair protein RecO [Planctomycetota bacterium]
MPSEKAAAIVIRAIDFSESSLIVTLFTREFGKIGALAKGAKRLKSPFESALDVLALCRIVFLRKSSDALDLLTEAKLLRRFRPAGRDLSALYAGYYVAELLGELTDQYDAHPELFDLADETLAALAAGEPVGRRLLRFELGLLQYLGHAPSLEACAGCGAALAPAARVSFGLVEGGVLCAACRPGMRHVATIQSGTVRAMARFAELHHMAWRELDLDARTYGELRGVVSQYIAHLLGRKPRLQPYVAAIRV